MSGPAWVIVLIGIVVFVLGTMLFSYLNVVIEELPLDILVEEEGKDPKTELEPLLKRLKRGKRCPHCGKNWRGKDNIPVLSWLCHGRLCTYCGKKVSARYMAIELLGGILAVLVFLCYGVSLSALTVFLAYAILTAIAFIDQDTQYIPPELNLMLAALGLLSIWTLPGLTLLERVIGVFCVSAPLFLLVQIIPDGFGLGDIKLMAAIGIMLGWKGTLVAFFIGLVAGGVYGAFLLIVRKKGKGYHFAFGPFLSVGIAISLYGALGTLLMEQYIDMIRIISMQP